jgi:hypothetical protein
MINTNTACSLAENLFVLSLVLNPKYTEITKQFLIKICNISLTLHQLEHYSFRTSNKTYFLQTKPYLTHFNEKSQSIWQGDQPTNIAKTSRGGTCARQSPSDSLANPALHTSLVSNTLNWDCANANEFSVVVEDINGVTCTRTYIQIGKSTNKVTGQNCQHNCPAGENICTKWYTTVSYEKWNLGTFPVTA